MGLDPDWNFDKPYLTKEEAMRLARLRKEGHVTFFRTRQCQLDGCVNETIPDKPFCSQEHYEKEHPPEKEEDDE